MGATKDSRSDLKKKMDDDMCLVAKTHGKTIDRSSRMERRIVAADFARRERPCSVGPKELDDPTVAQKSGQKQGVGASLLSEVSGCAETMLDLIWGFALMQLRPPLSVAASAGDRLIIAHSVK